jgi:hypothetical protein
MQHKLTQQQNLDELMKQTLLNILNEGYCDYVEVDALDEHEILDEGTDEVQL